MSSCLSSLQLHFLLQSFLLETQIAHLCLHLTTEEQYPPRTCNTFLAFQLLPYQLSLPCALLVVVLAQSITGKNRKQTWIWKSPLLDLPRRSPHFSFACLVLQGRIYTLVWSVQHPGILTALTKTIILCTCSISIRFLLKYRFQEQKQIKVHAEPNALMSRSPPVTCPFPLLLVSFNTELLSL